MHRPKRKPKGSYHHGELAGAIADAALELVRDQGLAGITIRRVAQRVGVSHAAIYHHFDDRTAILAGLAERGFLELGEVLRRAITGERPTLEQFRRLGRAYVGFALAHRELFRVMFGSEASERSRFPGLARAAETVSEQVRVLVVACQEDGAIVPGAAAPHALFAWSAVHGLASLLIENQVRELAVPHGSVEQLTELVLMRVIHGVGATRAG